MDASILAAMTLNTLHESASDRATAALVVGALTDGARKALTQALRAHREAELERAILAVTKDCLAVLCPTTTIRAVHVTTVQADNGWYYSSLVKVIAADGTETPFVNMGDLAEPLADRFGRVPSLADLIIDLEDGTIDADRDGEAYARYIDGWHDEYDECAKYDSDHTVYSDGVRVSVAEIEEGDVFEEDGQSWVAHRVGKDSDGQIHIEIRSAEGDDEDSDDEDE